MALSLLRHRLGPWTRNLCMPWAQQKNFLKIKTNKQTKEQSLITLPNKQSILETEFSKSSQFSREDSGRCSFSVMEALLCYLQCLCLHDPIAALTLLFVQFRLKKHAQPKKLRIKLYWGQNEDESLGGSISDRSATPLQRGRGKVRIYVILVKGGGPCNQEDIFAEMCCSSHEGYCQSRGADIITECFSAFLDMRRCKNWAPKIL